MNIGIEHILKNCKTVGELIRYEKDTKWFYDNVVREYEEQSK